MSNIVHAPGSLGHFAQSVADWEFLSDWLFWPPDVFALTSLVLARTGCYRRVVAHHVKDVQSDWARNVNKAAEAWKLRLGELLAKGVPALDGPVSARSDMLLFDSPHGGLQFLQKCVREVESLADVTLERLSVLELRGDQQAERLTDELLTLHAIADEACEGFGFKPYGPGLKPTREALSHCLGNLLLTSTGSLSVLPKHRGIVLPKLRTPQGGLSVRSFSHHVTFHETEVAVMWRSVPTPNLDEDTLNVLLVPWPSLLDEQSFAGTRDRFEVVRYFGFVPSSDGLFPGRVDALLELLEKLDRSLSRVHLLVFPECALTDEEFSTLLARLLDSRSGAGGGARLNSLPMVIAGVREDNSDGTGDEGIAHNEVRIASYFAGQWYVLSQRKHHRWKLDRDQIRMYGLEGRLPTVRNWFEDITIAQRRLTFLAPSGWLTLCPLICEDLARSDPVAEIVRGVGPALLTALLLDGPQLKVRWSARYAAVLADDPGTAVITLTARGMVRRSALLENDMRVDAKDDRQVVSLFKDQVRGAYELAVEGSGEQAILLTLAATMREEYTADGRAGHNTAPVFQYQGHRAHKLNVPKDVPEEGFTEEQDPEEWGRWFDIREMTAALFVIEAALILEPAETEQVLAWLSGETVVRPAPLPQRLKAIEDRLIAAQRDPASVGINADHPGWPSSTLRFAVERLREYFADLAEQDQSVPVKRWEACIALARQSLEASTARGDGHSPADEDGPGGDRGRSRVSDRDRARLSLAVPLAVLCALHDRLLLWRLCATLGEQCPAELTPLEAAKLLAEVEQVLAVHS